LIGVLSNFVEINSLKMVQGRFFTEEENTASAPVCVLGETTKVNLLGYDNAIGKYVKVNDTWLQVIGVLTRQATSDTDMEGVQAGNRNNLIIAPLNTVMRRFEDNTSYLKDEIDGIYMKVGRRGFHRDGQRRTRYPATYDAAISPSWYLRGCSKSGAVPPSSSRL
jgi:putative ABC transport system permease protein